MMNPSIYSYVKEQENNFQSDEVRVGENWNWKFQDHVQMIFHLKNSRFFSGENDYNRAFKNIMDPILNLSYWSEDIEVKDIVFYIENRGGRALSFLIKKYHEDVFVKEHNLDSFIDEVTESDIDYGGVLVQKTNTGRPEVIDLTTVAFCDQTDLMGGPVGLKFFFAPDRLRGMSKLGWGDEKNGATLSIEELITLADNRRDPGGLSNERKNETSGKVIEIYVVRGSLPEHYLEDNDNMEEHYNQVHVIAFYVDKDGDKVGQTLFRKKESESNLKFFTSKKVTGRALGRGVGETLLHPQIWTNFLTIHKTRMLEAASKTVLYTDDPSYTNRQAINDMDNLEITTVEEGKSIAQVPTAGVNNITLYANSINEWFEHSQLLGAAFDPILGKEAVSGTTFRGQERTVAQGRGLHDRRRGQRAKFIEEIYRDWIIPYMVRQIVSGKEFLATLTDDELSWVADQLAENYANREISEFLLDPKKSQEFVEGRSELPDKDILKEAYKSGVIKEGNKKLIKILEDEFRGIEIKIGINVANKQKDLVNLSDKLLSIFQFVFSNPQGFQQAMQIPALQKSFTDILEFSGLNQAEFTSLVNSPQINAPPVQAEQQLAQPVST